MAEDSLNGYEAWIEYGSLGNDAAMAALGEEAAELLFEEEELGVEDATEILEGRVPTAQRPHVSRVYGVMTEAGIIDLDRPGNLFNGKNSVYSKNGHPQKDVLNFVKQYNQASDI